MAIKELFQDSRPQVLFDPRASQRIDPRFKFTRDGVASYYDKDGVLRFAPANQPRVGFNYEPDENGVMQPVQGLLLEATRTNNALNSENISLWNNFRISTGTDTIIAPDGVSKSVYYIENTSTTDSIARIGTASTTSGNSSSVFLKARSGSTWVAVGPGQYFQGYSGYNVYVNLANGQIGTIGNQLTYSSIRVIPLPGGWYKVEINNHNNQFTSANEALWVAVVEGDGIRGTPGAGTHSYYVWGGQFEDGSSSVSSYIPTAGSEVTREPDLLSIEGTSLPSTGSIYIDARSLTSDVDDTLLSAANASDDKLALAIREPADLYSSKALVYEVDGAFKPTLPFPVPSNVRERNLITYGANNYHYRSDSSRLTPSSSTSVPANMNRLGIGHDVTDPTKAITGYINTVYLWPGEITPTVAEALVRGDLDPKDADAGVFTPETGALAFVFNTQGTATDGDKVVELPFGGSTNNVLVDWGDNTSSSFIGAAANSTVSHTYSAAGIYPVQITADDDGTNSGLETLTFYNSSQRNDLVRVLQWGGTTTWQPTTMYRAFRDCTQLDFETAARTNLPDTSAITNWLEAFYNCSNISGTFPTFDTSAATTFQLAWGYCSSMTSFPFIDSSNVINMQQAWRNCTSLTSFPLIDTSKVTNMALAWYACNSLTSFPLLDTGAVTSMSNAWYNCQFTSFPALNTSNVTNMSNAWNTCGELTSFPLINTSSVTTMSNAWLRCRKMTSFPLLNTSSVTDMEGTWYECETLASMPLINTSSVTDFRNTWYECSSLTSFPLINTAAGIYFNGAWRSCSSLTSFPLIDTSSGTNFSGAWRGCSSLTSFPLIDTSSGTNIAEAWRNCTSLTSFPAINTSANTNFYRTWLDCSSLTGTFPTIDTSLGTNFGETWSNCSITTFPALNFSSATAVHSTWESNNFTSFPAVTFPVATRFDYCWRYCSSLADFPANVFDSTGTLVSYAFEQAFLGCALTAASIENILVSLDTNGATGVTLTLSGGTNAAKSTWTSAANTAYTNLIGKGWSISYNP